MGQITVPKVLDTTVLIWPFTGPKIKIKIPVVNSHTTYTWYVYLGEVVHVVVAHRCTQGVIRTRLGITPCVIRTRLGSMMQCYAPRH